MAKVLVFIVFKLMTSLEFAYSRELSKSKNELKKIEVVHDRWSMDGVQGVVHEMGPRGGPWTGGQCFQLSLSYSCAIQPNFASKYKVCSQTCVHFKFLPR